MYRKIIKVFLGSPGDLEEERKAAKVIVDEENTNHAIQLGYHIDLVGWEDTVSQRRRAQDAINVDLDQCEYFVGLMWKKWGTPPGSESHQYSSGFEEEYRRSVNRHGKTGKPEISLLFKNIAKDDLIDVGAQLAKVLNFQKELRDEKTQLYETFQDIRDFEQKFRRIISKFLRDQQLEDQNSEINTPKKPKPVDEKNENREISVDVKKFFDGDAREFLNKFLNKEDTFDAYSAAEAARFRLLACAVSQSGNDNLVLGTHDSNLIYRDLRHLNLTDKEKRELLATGLENFGNSTVPIWHWLFESESNPQNALAVWTIISDGRTRRSAFQVLEKLSIAPNELEVPFDKARLPGLWFSEDASDDRVVAALDYLGSVGDEGIEVDWTKLIASSEANVARAAVRARTRIIARNNTADALRFVSQHESTDLGSELAEELLANISTIETEVLLGCLANKTTSFLKETASELSDRAALSRSDAQLLCESSDADVRLIGVRALAKHGPALSLADASKLLIKPRKTHSLSLLAARQERDYPGENAFEEYKIGILSGLPLDELQEMQNVETFYSTEATLAIYSGHFKNTKAQLEKDLVDGFESFCDRRRERLLDKSAAPSTAVFNFVRDKLLQSAFEVFCSRAAKSELKTVRKIIEEYEIKFSAEIAEYLFKNGEWEDAVRLAKLSGNLKSGPGFSLLSIVDHSRDYRLAAKSILKLGSKRIADVWKLEMSAPVRVQLVVQMPKKLFAGFDDQRIIEMLLLESDVLREAVALKSVFCLPKSRLSSILNAYYEVEGSYYYNAIFWLDLGVSADRSTSLAIAGNELSKK